MQKLLSGVPESPFSEMDEISVILEMTAGELS